MSSYLQRLSLPTGPEPNVTFNEKIVKKEKVLISKYRQILLTIYDSV